VDFHDILEYVDYGLEKNKFWKCLQYFDAVGWAAGRNL